MAQPAESSASRLATGKPPCWNVARGFFNGTARTFCGEKIAPETIIVEAATTSAAVIGRGLFT